MNDTHVLIVGAGPAGLTLATALAARNISFRIIDPLAEPVRESRAHGFGSDTLLALDSINLVEPMLAAAKKPLPILREYFGETLVGEIDYATVRRDPYPLMLPIFQQRVVRVLESALVDRGHRVEWCKALMTFARNEDGWLVYVDRDGKREAIRPRWIVGCDGSHSVVRKTLAVQFPGESWSGMQALFCECDVDWDRSADIWWTWQGAHGLVAAIYNDFTGKWHLLAVDLDQQDLGSSQSQFERIGALLREMSGDNVRLSNPAWVHSDTFFSQRIAQRFIEGRVALAGDAAHVFSSVAGQGLHFAIEDALNLGWKLAMTIAGSASPTLLETYDLERRAHANQAVRQTRSVQRFLTLSAAMRKIAWRALYVLGKHGRAISSIASKQAERLLTDYTNGPLTAQQSTQIAPRAHAGAHVRDARCRSGGRPSRLLDIVRGPEAHALFFIGLEPGLESLSAFRSIGSALAPLRAHLRVHYVFPSPALASRAGFANDDPAVIVDGLEQVHALFGIRQPEVVYVRPDGYIGLRTQTLDRTLLRDYLGRIYAKPLLNAFD